MCKPRDGMFSDTNFLQKECKQMRKGLSPTIIGMTLTASCFGEPQLIRTYSDGQAEQWTAPRHALHSFLTYVSQIQVSVESVRFVHAN